MQLNRRELLTRGLETAKAVAFVAAASKLGIKANAANLTPDNSLAFLKYVSWQPLVIDHAAAAKEGLILQGIPYRDLDEVRAIHGPGNWEFVPEEGKFAARLSDPNGNDVSAIIDPNTVAQGYKLLAEPNLPSGFREERFVAGHGINREKSEARGKGILVRRDVFPDKHLTYVLTQSTNNTNEENNKNGTGIDGITVIGIGGLAGPGDRSGFKGIPFQSLDEVARIYGGVASDYDWLRDPQNGNLLEGQYAAVFKVDLPGHRHFILAADTSYRTVVEGKRLLWSPTSTSEERVVASPGQYGIYIKTPIIRRSEPADNQYKFVYVTKTANTAADNFRDGTNIQVLGVNGFRGGEK